MNKDPRGVSNLSTNNSVAAVSNLPDNGSVAGKSSDRKRNASVLSDDSSNQNKDESNKRIQSGYVETSLSKIEQYKAAQANDEQGVADKLRYELRTMRDNQLEKIAWYEDQAEKGVDHPIAEVMIQDLEIVDPELRAAGLDAIIDDDGSDPEPEIDLGSPYDDLD